MSLCEISFPSSDISSLLFDILCDILFLLRDIYRFCFALSRFGSKRDIVPVYPHDIVKYTYTSPKIIYHNEESSPLRSQLFKIVSGELNAFNVS